MTGPEMNTGYAGPAFDQPRLPEGAPEGGRFTQIPLKEAVVSLAHLSDEEYNADGSFEYPPIPRSVEQHIAFWTRVKIPEAIMARVRSSYGEYWLTWVDTKMQAWEAANPEPVGTEWRSKSSEIEAWMVRRDAHRGVVEGQRRSSLPSILVRPLVRAAQMARYGSWLENQEEFDRVLETEVDLGESEPATVRETLRRYGVDEMPDHVFEDPGNFTGVNAATTQLRLAELIELLGGESDAG